jgi:hypothetical protein
MLSCCPLSDWPGGSRTHERIVSRFEGRHNALRQKKPQCDQSHTTEHPFVFHVKHPNHPRPPTRRRTDHPTGCRRCRPGDGGTRERSHPEEADPGEREPHRRTRPPTAAADRECAAPPPLLYRYVWGSVGIHSFGVCDVWLLCVVVLVTLGGCVCWVWVFKFGGSELIFVCNISSWSPTWTMLYTSVHRLL